jgi:hypothetical protein
VITTRHVPALKARRRALVQLPAPRLLRTAEATSNDSVPLGKREGTPRHTSQSTTAPERFFARMDVGEGFPLLASRFVLYLDR